MQRMKRTCSQCTSSLMFQSVTQHEQLKCTRRQCNYGIGSSCRHGSQVNSLDVARLITSDHDHLDLQISDLRSSHRCTSQSFSCMTFHHACTDSFMRKVSCTTSTYVQLLHCSIYLLCIFSIALHHLRSAPELLRATKYNIQIQSHGSQTCQAQTLKQAVQVAKTKPIQGQQMCHTGQAQTVTQQVL